MKKNLKISSVIVMVMVIVNVFAAIAAPALAQDPYGLANTAKAAGLKKAELPAVIGTIIGYGLSLIGIIFLILMLYGGILWMTSYGNEQKVTKAKDLIIGAIIGLIIVLAAYVITNFIVGAVTGAAGTK